LLKNSQQTLSYIWLSAVLLFMTHVNQSSDVVKKLYLSTAKTPRIRRVCV